MKIQAINGFKDILPEEVTRWQHIEQVTRDIFHRFNFKEIRLPILEETQLFARSIGQSTDIVEKEMYSFTDKGITMRPEATASLLRAFIEHGMHVQQPVHRLYTIGPMFRHERPQKGRLRQFHQLDAEIIGAVEPEVDAELMAMGQLLLTELGLEASLEVNSLGCPQCRPAFREKLVDYLENYTEQLCGDCRRRISTNPLRVLDCKNPDCKQLVNDAPSILDALCTDCNEHFARVKSSLDLLGVTYTANPLMVRGLDYYTRTTFEFIAQNLGAQSAVGAGGRYDGLIEELGGPKLSGIGFAMGIERLVLLLQEKDKSESALRNQVDIFIAALGDQATLECFQLAHLLRKIGIRAGMDYSGRSLKAQMKMAGRLGARFTLIVGEKELQEKKAGLRNMQDQTQEDFFLHRTPEETARNLKTIITESLPVNERPDFTRRQI
ncbi:MAG TPA: histidine--tRNA ligase [Desulfobacteraceae bacterium]|nr:histidine--tRNA ligase [Desulfobacteraceae bacterium]